MNNQSSINSSGNGEFLGFVLGARGEKIFYSTKITCLGFTKVVFTLGGKEITQAQVNRLQTLISQQEVARMVVCAMEKLKAEAMMAALRRGGPVSGSDLARFATSNSSILDLLGDVGAEIRSLYVGGVPHRSRNTASLNNG